MSRRFAYVIMNQFQIYQEKLAVLTYMEISMRINKNKRSLCDKRDMGLWSTSFHISF